MPHPPDPVQSKGLPSRIIFVRQQFTPFGGGGLVVDRIIGALAARGLKIALLARGWTGRNDIEFIKCDPPRFPRSLRERRFAVAACARLTREPDAIIQAHERIPCCDIFRAGDGVHAAYLAARARGLTPFARLAQAVSPYHRNILELERALFASPRLKAVIAVSAMVADDIIRHYDYPRARIHLVPTGVDLARFHPGARAEHRSTLRRKLGVDERRPVALMLGSGYAIKGLSSAIQAISKSRGDVELWVVGRGKRSSAYARQARRLALGKRVRFFGPQHDPVPYYASADVLLLPSVYDSFPSTVIEALACGLPVVTSTSCGARDAVACLDPALVRDAFDIEGLAQAVDRAFDLAAKPATADAARAIASKYSVERMSERLLALYETLIKDRIRA